MRPHNAKLLVVDDSPSAVQLVRELLRGVGVIDVADAADGVAGFDAFCRQSYDLVITDWNMPQMTGVELVRAIRTRSTRVDTPVLVMTATVNARRVVEAIDAGADGFVAKPLIPSVLCEKVLRLLGRAPPVADFDGGLQLMGGRFEAAPRDFYAHRVARHSSR